MKIFCDESGFTGDNLITDDQPYFIYSSVAIEEARAAEFLKKVQSDFRLQGNEVKGKNLIGSARGKGAIDVIVNEFAKDTRLVYHHKKYALACKFYEYMFEPVVAAKNSFFYELGFHKFIASIVYKELLESQHNSEQVMGEFQLLMTGTSHDKAKFLFQMPEQSTVLSANTTRFLHFIHLHKEVILEDYHSYGSHPPLMRWMLDLTQTSLNTLLQYWGEVYDSLDVYCDSSNPLIDNGGIFDAMIGRTDKVKQRIFGQERSLIYNLERPIRVVRSQDFAGVQIADIMATALNFWLKNPTDENSKKWARALSQSIDSTSIIPDEDAIDSALPSTIRNALIFEELMEK